MVLHTLYEHFLCKQGLTSTDSECSLLHFLGRGWRTAVTRTSFQAPHHSTISPPPWRLQSVEEQSVSTIAASAEGREHLDRLQLMKHFSVPCSKKHPERWLCTLCVCTFRMSREMIVVRGMRRKQRSSTAMASKARGRWGPVKQGTSPLMNHRYQRKGGACKETRVVVAWVYLRSTLLNVNFLHVELTVSACRTIVKSIIFIKHSFHNSL